MKLILCPRHRIKSSEVFPSNATPTKFWATILFWAANGQINLGHLHWAVNLNYSYERKHLLIFPETVFKFWSIWQKGRYPGDTFWRFWFFFFSVRALLAMLLVEQLNCESCTHIFMSVLPSVIGQCGHPRANDGRGSPCLQGEREGLYTPSTTRYWIMKTVLAAPISWSELI